MNYGRLLQFNNIAKEYQKSQTTCIFFIWSTFAISKLRHACALNYDHCSCNVPILIVDSPLCSCGMREDAYIFFPLLISNIQMLGIFINILLRLNELIIIDTHLLLWGDTS